MSLVTAISRGLGGSQASVVTHCGLPTLPSLKVIRGVPGFTKCWGSLSTRGPSDPDGGSLGPLCSALGANGTELLAGPLPLECDQQKVRSVGV